MRSIDVKLVAKIFIFNKKGELLLLRRHPKNLHRPGGWDLPGGKVEQGENPNDAVLRELYEETGLHAKDCAIVHLDTSNQEGYLISLLYAGQLDYGVLELSLEHQEFAWIKPEAIKNFDIPQKYKNGALAAVKSIAS